MTVTWRQGQNPAYDLSQPSRKRGFFVRNFFRGIIIGYRILTLEYVLSMLKCKEDIMTKVLIVRAKPHGTEREQEFLEGTVSIGYPDVANVAGLSREAIQREVEIAYPDEKNRPTRAAVQIFNFSDLKIGDFVITPSLSTYAVHFFEVQQGYKFCPEFEEAGNPHRCKVRFLKTVVRNMLPRSLQDSLNAGRKAVTDITNQLPLIRRVLDLDTVVLEEALKEISNAKSKLERTLEALLDSSSEEIRLKAAIALVELKGINQT
jgi:predicted Mrr-cat superfamily restriction endonuclease